MYTEFPKFTENSLSCTVEPIFNTTNSGNHCFNDRVKKIPFFFYIQFISAKLTPLPACKNWKESTKTYNRKKILSILSCVHCYGTSEQAMQAFLSFLHTVPMYMKICIYFHKRQKEKSKGKCNYFLGEVIPLMV